MGYAPVAMRGRAAACAEDLLASTWVTGDRRRAGAIMGRLRGPDGLNAERGPPSQQQLT